LYDTCAAITSLFSAITLQFGGNYYQRAAALSIKEFLQLLTVAKFHTFFFQFKIKFANCAIGCAIVAQWLKLKQSKFRYSRREYLSKNVLGGISY